ncbi:hypothetical protein Tco_1553279 [Tanacetum coccineum]
MSNDSNVEYLRANLNIKGMSNSRRTSSSNVDYMLYPSLLRTVIDWKGKPSLRSTERSLLHDNIIPKPDLALELGKSISLNEAEEEAVAREVHATHARIVSGPDPEPMQEGPSAGSNQGRSAKRRRLESAASGSAQPPSKDDHQSSKKPRESDASASIQHPALTSTGWQITDTRDDVVNSSMPRSDTESEHSEQSSDDILMQDEGHASDLEDTDNAHIPKVSTTT